MFYLSVLGMYYNMYIYLIISILFKKYKIFYVLFNCVKPYIVVYYIKMLILDH